MKLKKEFLFGFFFISTFNLFSQEVLKSVEEEYYDFLSLSGIVKKDFLTYRTLSDSIWIFTDDITAEVDGNFVHPWENKNLGTTYTLFSSNKEKLNFFEKGINNSLNVKIYGPEWYNNYNTATPWGDNDGALWQGRGYNTSFSTGVRIDGFGASLTCRPQLSFSQNKDFDIMPSKYGNGFGYFWGACDSPQRFGDSSFWTFDWGDTELRYTWHTLTVGAGTQSIWLGPAHENTLLFSNNAPTFPKLDFGIKKTNITIPYLNWDLGEFETRIFVGKLFESDYFDNKSTNDERQINGWTISYSPSFLKGFTVGFNKICMCYWGDDNWFYYLNPFYKGNVVKTSSDVQGEDQKASFNFDWNFEEIQFDVYAEIGVDDYPSKGVKLYEYARFPFHTMTYTVGLKKGLTVSEKNKLFGLINFEWNCTEASQDYQMWPGSGYNFGFHHQIRQGWTNKGQWLGSGIGYGGNNQYLSFTLFSNHGYEKLFIGRNNPDNNFIWSKCVEGDSNYNAIHYFTAFKANFYVGAESLLFVLPSFWLKSTFTYDLVINPLYNPGYSSSGSYREYNYLHNFSFGLTAKYNF